MIERQYSGDFEIIGENGVALFTARNLGIVMLVRDYLSGLASLTENEAQVAKAAITAFDEERRILREEHEHKRNERREKAKARAAAKKAVQNE